MNRSLPRRLAAAAVSVSVLVGAPLAGAGPVAAAGPGTVRLSQSSGSVDATPIFAGATASRPCPRGYGRDALLRVGRPGGPYTNLARPLVAGGYDRTAVSARPNRSFTTALGGAAPGAGQWEVVVECFSESLGMYPRRFVTPIVVTGRVWRVGSATAAAGRPGGSTPAEGAIPTGAPPTASTRPSPSPSGSEGSRLDGIARSGSASPLVGAWWLLGVTVVLLVVGGAWLATRRGPARTGPASSGQGSRDGAPRGRATRPPSRRG